MSETYNPTHDQTLTAIEDYLRAVEEGSEIAIRNTHGGILMFQITKVTGTNPRSGRLYTNKSDRTGRAAWYMKIGKNCFHPTGQSRLFAPTEQVQTFLREYPSGISTYETHTPE